MLKRFFIFLIVAVLFLGVLLVWWRDATSPVEKNNDTVISFLIPKGQGIKEIANDLKDQGLIKDKLAFFAFVRFSNLGQKIQAGNFQLKKSMSVYEIASQLTHGTDDVRLVIIEGWRIEEIASEVSQNLQIPEAEFLKYAKEGYLFPDTYLIPKEASASTVAKVMLDNFQKRVNQDLIDKAESQGLNTNNLITLASIVEREAKGDEDRKMVAGILLKRLRNDWPLQTDATIQYALGYQAAEKTWWKKNLTAEDLQIDSLYNTYTYTGLPPGPICSPGMSAIEAVASPKKSEFWYYLSDEKGNLHYAVTQEEQEVNTEKYLR